MSNNQTALITGASGGIGEALARELAAKGHDLVLVARSVDKLNVLALELEKANNVKTHTISLDLSVPGAGRVLAGEVRELGLVIDVLVNNAGFADFGPFVDADPDKTIQMAQLNMVTLTELTQALLPGMVARRQGRVLNVASTAAFMPGPLMAVYYSTKAFVLHFSEAVHEELKGSGVTITALCPGPTETGFQQRAAMENSKLVKGKKIMSAEKVAALGVAGMLKGKPLVVTGLKNKWQAMSPKFAPRSIIPGMVKRAQAASH